jgi:hypothetical protein
MDKNVIRKLKYVVKITDFAFSRKLSRKFPQFSLKNFRENGNKFSRKCLGKCENENFRFHPNITATMKALP